jgi:2-hydroxycyclohexanecarboxyl-CoA dehydrogenase
MNSPATGAPAAGRTAVVTGAASGIGLAVAQHLAARGHRVALIDRRGGAAREAARQLRGQGAEALAATADVTDRAGLDDALSTVRAAFGPVGIIVTSAGVEAFTPVTEITAQDWDRLLAVNVASKGGVIGLTKALAVELAARGITVNTIPPSIIDTPMARQAEKSGDFPGVGAIAAMTPVRRAGTPGDVAAACAFLCSDQASFITGQVIGVNGGWYL